MQFKVIKPHSKQKVIVLKDSFSNFIKFSKEISFSSIIISELIKFDVKKLVFLKLVFLRFTFLRLLFLKYAILRLAFRSNAPLRFESEKSVCNASTLVIFADVRSE